MHRLIGPEHRSASGYRIKLIMESKSTLITSRAWLVCEYGGDSEEGNTFKVRR